jgi:hypothetical protein
MSAPIALIKASAYSSPPTNNTEYGKGDFLVGFFGEAIKYSLDGQIWYEHPKHYDWAKGNYVELDNITVNENDKTLDFTSTPIFISSFSAFIEATSTSGSRYLYYRILGSNSQEYGYFGTHDPSEVTMVFFGGGYNESDLSSGWTNVISLPKFWNESTPFWNKIAIKDNSNIDSNDDFYIYLRGVYALPKYHWIEFKNCKNFQVEKVVESLGDGVFTSGSEKPHSLKILKI